MSEQVLQQQGQYEDNDEYEIDLGVLISDMLKGFGKYWWILLIICIISSVLFYVQDVLRYKPQYEATASFTVSLLGNEEDASYGFDYNGSSSNQVAAAFPYLLDSDVFQDMMKEGLGTDEIEGEITVEAVSTSNLFMISVVSDSQAKAQEIIEAALEYLPEVSNYVIGQTRLNLIQSVDAPLIPYNQPQLAKDIAIGLAIGLMICFVFLAVYAFLRKTIRKEEDFRERLNMHCVGAIPQVVFKAHGKQFDRSVSVTNKKAGRAIREAFRSLSLKVERRMEEKDHKTLLVTSTLPGEGKSTVAMNLALVLAEKGYRVLLLDLDLRHPSIFSQLNPPKESGQMEGVLLGKIPPGSAVRKLESGLYFLGADKPCEDIMGLLTKPMLKRMISGYSKRMDYIIIDTPPCGLMTDAAIISECCDEILYVVHQDMASEWKILDAIQQLGGRDVELLGGVLNGAESSLGGYGKYGYGKYGYGKYGYGGYGSYGSKSRSK